LKEFHTKVEGFDSLIDDYYTENYISRGDSVDEAIKYAKIMFLSEHEDCHIDDLVVECYSINID